MADGHEHYQQLAVGHVLGGLGPDDDAAFRSHLLDCRDCRARVAELRGIASDLERAERDERARATLTTEVERRAPEDEPARGGPDRAGPDRGARIGIRHVTVAVIVVAVLAGGMAFWNLHLRTSNALIGSVAEQHARTLEVLADGVALDVEADHPVRGVAATNGEHVALSLVGLEVPGEGERLVAWVHGEDGPAPVGQIRPSRVEEGTAALVIEASGAQVLEVRRETGELDGAPGGERLARVELRAP